MQKMSGTVKCQNGWLFSGVIHFSKIFAKDHRINIYYDIYSTHEKYRFLQYFMNIIISQAGFEVAEIRVIWLEVVEEHRRICPLKKLSKDVIARASL